MNLLKKTILFIITFIIMIFFLDRYLNISEISPVSINTFSNNYCGRIFKANTKYTFFNEGFTINKVNEYSYLNKGYPQRRAPNTVRIALFGDSYVESNQVFNRNYFGTILENQLNLNIKSSNQKYEVLNFGRSAFGFENMFAFYESFGKDFKPDFTLFFVSIENYSSSSLDPLSPKITFINTEDYTVGTNLSQSSYNKFKHLHKFVEASSFMYILNNCRLLTRKGKIPEILFDKFAPHSIEPIKMINLETKSYITDKNLQILEKMSQDPKIIIVNRSDNPYPDEIQELISNNFKFIDLSIVLENLDEQGINPHYWKATNKNGHWNNSAHKAISEYLSTNIPRVIK